MSTVPLINNYLCHFVLQNDCFVLPGEYILICLFTSHNIIYIVDCQGFLPQTCYSYNKSTTRRKSANIELYAGLYVFRQKRITNTIRQRKGNHDLKASLYKIKVHHSRSFT